MKKWIVTIGLMIACVTSASAQTPCKYITTRAVLTAAQWNWCYQQKQDILGFDPVNKAGDVMLGRLVTSTPSGSKAGLNLLPGTAPLAPADGDIWTTTSGLYFRINGVTVGPAGTASAANPTATAGSAAVNGVASTYMRSDAAPAVAQGTNATKGVVRGDTTTITCTAGVCSATVPLPTPTRAGDVIYWNGTTWVTIAGNNSGTGVLAENSSGVPSWYTPATLQASPANRASSSTTSVMAGFGSTCTITPTLTGRLRVSFNSYAVLSAASTFIYQIKYGTGTAPTAGVAATGTSLGSNLSVNQGTGGATYSTTSSDAIVTGLTPGTAYWFDLSEATLAGTSTLSSVTCNAYEF